MTTIRCLPICLLTIWAIVDLATLGGTAVCPVGAPATDEPKWLTEAQVSALVAQHWPADLVDIATSIAMCESGGNTRAVHHGKRDRSLGLFQINTLAWGRSLGTDSELRTAAHNVRAALRIYRQQGWRAWLRCARLAGVL